MASTQKSLRLLRNATIYHNKDAAFNALRDMTIEDGVPVLARYTEAGKEKTLLGLYSKIADGTKHMTIFDFDSDAREALEQKIENMSDDVTTAITAAINNLNKADTAVEGEYVSSVSEENGIITVTRVELPTVSAITEAGKPIVAVAQNKGTVSASAGTINAEFVNVTGSVFSSTTVQGALEKIETEYKAADNALKTEILGDATTSGNTLGKLEDRIEALDADAATYTIRKDTENLPATVKERYTLVETKNGSATDKQVTIDIAKDSHIVSIRYISDSADTHYQNLEYKYLDVNGVEQTEHVDMSQLVLEAEFASGVTVTDHIAHGVVDPTSEKFLTVGADGFKLSGVQSAIDNAVSGAVSGLDYTDTAVAGQYVSAVSESDGVISVERGNVSEAALNNYAKGTKPADLAVASTDTINQAIAKLEHQVDDAKSQAQASKTIVQEGTDVGNHMEISSATPQGSSAITYTINLTDIASDSALTAEIDARKAVEGQNGDTYAANRSANYISGATSMNDADVKLDTALSGVADKVDTLSGKSITGVEMTGGTAAITANTDGTKKITINTDASQLTTVNQISGATPIAAGTSVENALQTIYDNVSANKVVGSNAITTGTSDSNTQVSLKLDEAHTDGTTEAENQQANNHNALSITNDGLFLSDIWDAGYYAVE